MSSLPIILFLLMCPAGRLIGIGGLSLLRYVGLLIFGCSFGLGAVAIWDSLGAFLSGGIAVYGVVLGHGNFYAMTGARDSATSAPEKIEKVARPLWLLFRKDIHTTGYSQFCMGTKWLVVSAPILPIGLLTAIAAPINYTISFRDTQDSALAEWLNGIIPGAVIAALCLFYLDRIEYAVALLRGVLWGA